MRGNELLMGEGVQSLRMPHADYGSRLYIISGKLYLF